MVTGRNERYHADTTRPRESGNELVADAGWPVNWGGVTVKNDYRDKRVLITGGLGFIGSNLARELVGRGAMVTVIDNLDPNGGGNIFNIHDTRDKITVRVCDLRAPSELDRLIRDQDFLFNLAAQSSHIASMTDPHADLDINTTAQLSILETCRVVNPGIKIVFASTRQIYGSPDYLPVDEKHPIRPVDVNGINKFAGEQYHRLYNNVYGVRSCTLRMTNTYGAGMRSKDARQSFLGTWVRRLIENKPIEVFGDGRQRRDFNHVDDCVEALLLAGASDVANGKAYNLGGTEVIDLKSLAMTMINLGSGGSFEIVPFPRENKAIDIGDYYGDFSLIRNELGWTPKVDLREGLARTVDFYRANHARYWSA